MIFDDIQSGDSVFVDANIFVYAFAPEPRLGPSSFRLLERIKQNDIQGYTSTHILSDVAHRLMTLEACATFGWNYAGVVSKLKRHQSLIGQLTRFRQALAEIVATGIEVIAIHSQFNLSAADLSIQHGLLSGDALVLAAMQFRGLKHLASHDVDFDRVPGISRYAPM